MAHGPGESYAGKKVLQKKQKPPKRTFVQPIAATMGAKGANASQAAAKAPSRTSAVAANEALKGKSVPAAVSVAKRAEHRLQKAENAFRTPTFAPKTQSFLLDRSGPQSRFHQGYPNGERPAWLTPTEFKGQLNQRRSEAKAGRKEAYRKSEYTGFDVGPVHVSPLDVATLGLPGVGFGADVAKLGATKLAERGAGAVTKRVVAPKAAEVLSKMGGAAKAVRSEAKAAKAARGKGLTRLKTGPKRTVTKLRQTPAAARELATKEGRRVAATKGGAKVYSHPVVGAAVATSAGGQTGAYHGPGAGTLPGLAAALHHPVQTGETTARAIPGAAVAIGALAKQAGKSVASGSPTPLVYEVGKQAMGMAQIVKHAASSDPKVAQKAFQQEGALALLAPLPAVTRLKAYEGLRGKAREGASAARRKVASKSEGLNVRVRHAPKGAEPHIFGGTARHDARKTVALARSRSANPHRLASSRHEQALATEAAKANHGVPGSHVVYQTFAEYGIRDAKGAALVRAKGPGDKQLIAALDFAKEHPEVFANKHVHGALAALDTAARNQPHGLVGLGERARLMQQGDLFGHTRPEDMLPEAAKPHTAATTRAGAWEHAQGRDKEIARWRAVAAKARAHAEVLKGPERAAALADVKGALTEAKALQKPNHALKAALDRYVRPWHDLNNSERTSYDGAQLAEYKGKVEGSVKQSPLVDAIWTQHHEAGATPGTGLDMRYSLGRGQKDYMRVGAHAKADKLDRSFLGLVHGTVHGPLRRAGDKEFLRELGKHRLTYTWNGKVREEVPTAVEYQAITSRRTPENPNGGQYSSKDVKRLALAEIQNAIKDPTKSEADLQALLDTAEQSQVKGHASSILLPAEMIHEARLQLHPEHNVVTRSFNKFAHLANKMILGTSPMWAASQVLAEGGPMVLAHPELLATAAPLLHDLKKFRKDNPAASAKFDAEVGASPEYTAGALQQPQDLASTIATEKGLLRGRTRRGAEAVGRLRGLGILDIKRQNAYRTALGLAEAEKRFMGVGGKLYQRRHGITGVPKFADRHEMLKWLTTDAKGVEQLHNVANYVDDVQGNWTSFSSHERAIAPFSIFYPFQRYALRWPYTMARQHPFKVTALALSAEANANEIEKILGGKPESPFVYSFPVIHHTRDEGTYQRLVKAGLSKAKANQLTTTSVLPGGSRISPGQSAIQQALMTGDPAALIGMSNPFIGAGVTALGGPGAFGSKPTQPKGYAALQQLASMPLPAREFLQTDKGKKLWGQFTGHQQTALSKAFAELDPNKVKRGLYDISAPQSGVDFWLNNELSRALSDASANSRTEQNKIKYDASISKAEATKRVNAMVKKYTAAQKRVGFVEKLISPTLAKQDKQLYNQRKAIGSPFGSTGGSSSGNPYSLSPSANPYALSSGKNPYVR